MEMFYTYKEVIIVATIIRKGTIIIIQYTGSYYNNLKNNTDNLNSLVVKSEDKPCTFTLLHSLTVAESVTSSFGRDVNRFIGIITR